MALQAPLPWSVVAALAIEAGFPPGDAVIAVSITEPESARIQNNVQQGQPYATTGWGLWQITPGNSVRQFGTDDAMLIGINNARAAHAKWKDAGGFGPWTTWHKGLNVPYLGDAERAVAAVTKLSLTSLTRLADSAGAQVSASVSAADAAAIHVSDVVAREVAVFSKLLIFQRMQWQRMYTNGWLP